MIIVLGSISYEEAKTASASLLNSSTTIRKIIDKYGDNLSEIVEFCNSLDAYIKFIDSNISLNIDADEALRYMMEKNQKA